MKVPIYGSTLKADPSKRLKPKARKRLATKAEITHLESVKSLNCAFCSAPPPSEAHHERVGSSYKNHYMTFPLCSDCHRALHANRSAYREPSKMALQATLYELRGAEEAKRLLRLAGRDPDADTP